MSDVAAAATRQRAVNPARHPNPPCVGRGANGSEHRFRDVGRRIGFVLDRCDRPRIRQCWRCSFRVTVRCRSTRARICSPCATSHRHRVRLIARSGIGGVGRSEAFMLTLTAPGSDEHLDIVHGGVCPCTPAGGIDLALWNALLPIHWNRFVQTLRRESGAPSPRGLPRHRPVP